MLIFTLLPITQGVNAFLSQADLDMKEANNEVMDSLVRIYKAKLKPLEQVLFFFLPFFFFFSRQSIYLFFFFRDTDLIIITLA